MLFRKRNILGAALVAGIGLGVYLGQFKGFGLGGSNNWGIGSPNAQTSVSTDGTNQSKTTTNLSNDSDKTSDDAPTAVPKVVKVIIDDRAYLLRGANGNNSSITLSNLIKLIKQAPGDEDGVRVRIYEKANARMSADENLKKALEEAEIPSTAIFWVPTSMNDFEKR